jgi:hypothetical protein
MLKPLAGFLEGNPCEVYATPFEVRSNADSDDDTVVPANVLEGCMIDLRVVFAE